MPVYLTFDIDALDPSAAPGTGTPVIGGPSAAQVRKLLYLLKGIHVVAADLVEVLPAYDQSEICLLYTSHSSGIIWISVCSSNKDRLCSNRHSITMAFLHKKVTFFRINAARSRDASSSFTIPLMKYGAVSYTHLDVYKRQA